MDSLYSLQGLAQKERRKDMSPSIGDLLFLSVKEKCRQEEREGFLITSRIMASH